MLWGLLFAVLGVMLWGTRKTYVSGVSATWLLWVKLIHSVGVLLSACGAGVASSGAGALIAAGVAKV